MQTNLNLATKEQVRRTWAFAIDSRRDNRRRRKTMADFRHCIVTACSKEARVLGIRAGMRLDEAKLRIPELRVLITGGRT